MDQEIHHRAFFRLFTWAALHSMLDYVKISLRNAMNNFVVNYYLTNIVDIASQLSRSCGVSPLGALAGSVRLYSEWF